MLVNDTTAACYYWWLTAKFGLVRIDSKNGNYNLETSDQRTQDINTIDYESRIKSGWYDQGLAIRLGKTIVGKYYGVAIDFDGMDAILAWFGSWNNVIKYAKNNRVEWHKNPNNIHLIFYTDRPLANKKISISSNSRMEVLCEGSLLRVSASIHDEDGNAFVAMDSEQIPIVNSLQLMAKINSISDGYISDDNKEQYLDWLHKPDTILGVNGGRHDAILAIVNSYFWKYEGEWLNLSDNERSRRAWEWAEYHCKPNRSREEFDRICQDVTKKFKAKRDEQHNEIRDREKEISGGGGNGTKLKKKDQAISAIKLSGYHFATLEDTDEIRYYASGTYNPGGEIIIKKIIQDELGTDASINLRREVLEDLRIGTYKKREEFDGDPNIINIKTGLFYVKEHELRPHTPDYLSLRQKPIPYDPRKYSVPKECLRFLQTIVGDQSDFWLLVRLMAYSFYRATPWEVIVTILGGGNNGKSVFTKLMKALHGDDMSTTPMRVLANSPYGAYDLLGKDINLDEELSNSKFEDTALIKKLTGNQYIRIEGKWKAAFEAKLNVKLWNCANKIPRSDDDSVAWARRQIVLPFPNTFVLGCCAIPEYEKKLMTESELSGLFNLLMWTLKAILRQQKLLPHGLTVDKQREKYEMATNPVGTFLEEAVPEDAVASDAVTKEILYAAFEYYCKKHRLPKISYIHFCRTLKQRFNIVDARPTEDANKYSIWIGISLTKEYVNVTKGRQDRLD